MRLWIDENGECQAYSKTPEQDRREEEHHDDGFQNIDGDWCDDEASAEDLIRQHDERDYPRLYAEPDNDDYHHHDDDDTPPAPRRLRRKKNGRVNRRRKAA